MMRNMSTNTRKTKDEIEDSLNRVHIDQLHNAVLEFNKQSFDVKKLCITVEISAFTLVVTLFMGNYSDAMFIPLLSTLGLLIPMLFYIVDASTYFYQDKLRNIIDDEEHLICARHNIPKDKNPRFTNTNNKKRILRSIIAWPNILVYWSLMLLSIIIPRMIIPLVIG